MRAGAAPRRAQAVAEEHEDADAVLAMAGDVPRLKALVTFARGVALTTRGDVASAASAIREGLTAVQATGTVLDVPWMSRRRAR